MGKVFSVIGRKINRFNIENRAHRSLDNEIRPKSPWHPSSQAGFQQILEDSPGFKQEESQKDATLDEYLKKVYITSTDVGPTERVESKKPLPQNRRFVEDHEYGFYEPPVMPKGFCTLRQALKFISDHQGDPKLWNAQSIAREYNLDETKTKQVLQYYKAFEVYIPQIVDKKPKGTFTKILGKIKQERIEEGESSSKA